ncbi:hypothetical protein [Streptomyces sp. NPDC049879]|uniref:hypothetical protein n=1 Tax=Streptomyces sp. NPDC049879 TaxID=3365598 RepID=UPI00378B99C8
MIRRLIGRFGVAFIMAGLVILGAWADGPPPQGQDVVDNRPPYVPPAAEVRIPVPAEPAWVHTCITGDEPSCPK